MEIFYDLFFAAAYNNFTNVKKVTDVDTFKASIGFFWYVQPLLTLVSKANYFLNSLMWLTWLAVSFFEVRYATDSIFCMLVALNALAATTNLPQHAPQRPYSSAY